MRYFVILPDRQKLQDSLEKSTYILYKLKYVGDKEHILSLSYSIPQVQ